jgi:hypothetical protein
MSVIIDQQGRIATTIYGPVSRTALEGYANQLGV